MSQYIVRLDYCDNNNIVTYRLLKSLQNFLDEVEIEQEESSTMNVTNSSHTAVFAFETFALQVQQVDPKAFNGQMFSIHLGSVEEAWQDNQTINQGALVTSKLELAINLINQEEMTWVDTEGILNVMSDTTALLMLPEDLLDSCSDIDNNLTTTISQRLSYSVYKSDVLFQNFNQSHLSIGSIIVAVRLKCANDLTLNTSIKSVFQVNKMVNNIIIISYLNDILHFCR